MTDKEKLAIFNEIFPDSKYRKIASQVILPEGLDTHNPDPTVPELALIKRYKAGKAPLNKTEYSYDEIKEWEGRLGWIVPKDIVVVDIDDNVKKAIIGRVLERKQIKCAKFGSRNGGHVLFTNKTGVNQVTDQSTSLGITIDTRCLEKGYIILPYNDTDRRWNPTAITNELQEIPYFLRPLKSIKKTTKTFYDMKDGEGRNSTLFKHAMNLKDYAPELSLEETISSVEDIAYYIFKDPMSSSELYKTILNEANLEKLQNRTPKNSGDKQSLSDLSKKIAEENKIISVTDALHMYNGKYYEYKNDREMERFVFVNYESELKKYERTEVIEYLKLACYIEPHRINVNWNEIVVKNGILDLSTMKLKDFDSSKYNTTYINYDFKTSLKEVDMSDTVVKFMAEFSNHDDDKRKLLYEIMGYSLLRKNLFGKFFILYGVGGSGKSTYLDLIRKLIGDHNVSSLELPELNNPQLLFDIYNKLVNLGDDVPSKTIHDTSKLKKITTGNPITLNEKYGKIVPNYKPFCTLIFTANERPKISEKTTGLSRRIMFIKIHNIVRKPDLLFLEKITNDDMEFILYKAVEAIYNALKNTKLTSYKELEEDLVDFREHQSRAVQFVLEEYDNSIANIHKVGVKPNFVDVSNTVVIFFKYKLNSS